VRTRIDMVKDSNLRVLENDHNVIIGWSRLSIPLLQQAAAPHLPSIRPLSPHCPSHPLQLHAAIIASAPLFTADRQVVLGEACGGPQFSYEGAVVWDW
jgi:hypothetical protein